MFVFFLIIKSFSILASIEKTLNEQNFEGESKYVAVIDAGSTGTRLNIFGYLMPGNILYDYQVYKTSPGLHTLTDKEIKDQLIYLIKNMNKKIPVSLHGTAGLRLLDKDKQENVINVVNSTFKKYNLKLKDASIISGLEEGIYALESLNFLCEFNNFIKEYGCKTDNIKMLLNDSGFCDENLKLDKICINNDTTLINDGQLSSDELYTGIIDMGGGSVQLAYEFPLNDPFESPIHVIHTSKKKIYLNSFLGWGLVEGLKVLQKFRKYKYKDRTMFDELLKDFKRAEKPDINNVDRLFLLSFFYEKFNELGFNFKVTIKEVKEKYDERCKKEDNKFCDEIYYMYKFLEAQGIDKNKTMYLLKDIAGISINWAVARGFMML